MSKFLVRNVKDLSTKVFHERVSSRTFFVAWEDNFESSIRFLSSNTLKPYEGSELHVHESMEEFYFVLSGKASIRCGDETADVGAGDAIYLPANVPHSIQNTDSSPFCYIVCGARILSEIRS